MPKNVFTKLGSGKSRSRPSIVMLQMVDVSLMKFLCIIEDVLVRVDKLILSIDFVALDIEKD